MAATEKKMTMGHMLLTALMALGGGGAYLDTNANVTRLAEANAQTVGVKIAAVEQRVAKVERDSASKEVVAAQLESVKTQINHLQAMIRDVKASQSDLKALLIQALQEDHK